MEIRHPVHPSHARQCDTEALRRHFLLEDLFAPGALRLVYTHYDRLIVGGAEPLSSPLRLEGEAKATGSEGFLARRELGVVNVGAPGSVIVDGKEYRLGAKDGLYVGLGAREVGFASLEASSPARFYLLSAPAHRAYPTTPAPLARAQATRLGTAEEANRRTIYRMIHPEGVASCQLVMGLTTLEPGSVWNTMPAHTHERRVEAYLYFGLGPDDLVFHIMGEPGETRHLVVRDCQGVLSPSWSLHAGVGTRCYSFVWGMAGENQVFSDMDGVPLKELR